MTKNDDDSKEPEVTEETKEVWEECNSVCVNPNGDSCPYLPCDAILDDWGRLQYILDMIDDINEKVGFLQTLTSRNQHVCFNGKCPIFDAIMDLRGQIADFDLPITALENIKNSNLSPQRRNILKNKYDKAKFECDVSLQKIMTVATVNKAKEAKEDAFVQRKIELIREMNQSNFPLPVEVKSNIEDMLNSKNVEEWEAKANQKKEKENKGKNKK